MMCCVVSTMLWLVCCTTHNTMKICRNSLSSLKCGSQKPPTSSTQHSHFLKRSSNKNYPIQKLHWGCGVGGGGGRQPNVSIATFYNVKRRGTGQGHRGQCLQCYDDVTDRQAGTTGVAQQMCTFETHSKLFWNGIFQLDSFLSRRQLQLLVISFCIRPILYNLRDMDLFL